jgi:hypothetical protein
MSTSKYERIGVVILLLLNLILVGAVINLGAFASKGPRYTAADGDRDRQERITSDLALSARIDLLHNLLTEQAESEPAVTSP